MQPSHAFPCAISPVELHFSCHPTRSHSFVSICGGHCAPHRFVSAECRLQVRTQHHCSVRPHRRESHRPILTHILLLAQLHMYRSVSLYSLDHYIRARIHFSHSRPLPPPQWHPQTHLTHTQSNKLNRHRRAPCSSSTRVESYFDNTSA